MKGEGGGGEGSEGGGGDGGGGGDSQSPEPDPDSTGGDGCAEGGGGGSGSGGDGGGNGTIASKQRMKPPRTTDESVDQVSRVPAGAALMLDMALKAAVPDVVPGQYPFRAQLAQLGPGAPGAPGQMPGVNPEAEFESG